MAKIITDKVPRVGQTFNIFTETPTSIGNAISIFVRGARVGLARVVESHADNPRFTSDKYVDPRRVTGTQAATNMGNGSFGVKVETIFDERD